MGLVIVNAILLVPGGSAETATQGELDCAGGFAIWMGPVWLNASPARANT